MRLSAQCAGLAGQRDVVLPPLRPSVTASRSCRPCQAGECDFGDVNPASMECASDATH